jgi:hypothetical protein
VGDKVTANFQGHGNYFRGTIKRVDSVAATVDIDYEDGDAETNVSFDKLQKVLTKESIGLKGFEAGQQVLYINAPEEEDLWQDDGDAPQVGRPSLIAHRSSIGCK